MRLLWPQSLTVELSAVLARSASAGADYLRAVLHWWNMTAEERRPGERALLAPARRACGLTSQDAEEALDRILLDPLPSRFHLGQRTAPATESALTFTTYIRRFTQCLTTLAAVATPTSEMMGRMTHLVGRLDAISASLLPRDVQGWPTADVSASAAKGPESLAVFAHFDPEGSLAEQMLQRMERQTGVLERATVAIHGGA